MLNFKFQDNVSEIYHVVTDHKCSNGFFFFKIKNYKKLLFLWLEQSNKSLIMINTPLIAQLVKNQPAMGEIWVQSLGSEDPLEKGKATHSSILAWRIPRTV